SPAGTRDKPYDPWTTDCGTVHVPIGQTCPTFPPPLPPEDPPVFRPASCGAVGGGSLLRVPRPGIGAGRVHKCSAMSRFADPLNNGIRHCHARESGPREADLEPRPPAFNSCCDALRRTGRGQAEV